MKLSVVILNYNVSSFLELCIVSVRDALVGIDAEIIVVDNNSIDDSCCMIKEKFPEVYLIENKQNLGFPKGNNIGVEYATGEYICILNPDTVVAEDTFKKVIEFADNKIDLGAIGVRLIDGKGLFLPESKRGIPTPWAAFTKVTGIYKLFKTNSFFNGYYATQVAEKGNGVVDILVGAFMLMRKEDYQQVGGFDEGCFMYSDDIDLSYLLLKQGLKNYYLGETSVIHYKGESTIRDASYVKRFSDAMNYFYKKHFKVSFVFNLFSQVAIFVFTFLKKKKKDYIKNEIDFYVFYGCDVQKKRKLKLALGNDIKLVENEEALKLFLRNHSRSTIEIILDNELLSFKAIINSLQEFSSPLITFRIIPKTTSFIIGSDSSETRGEIVSFKNVSLE